MDIEYKTVNWKGEYVVQSESVESFAANYLLYKDYCSLTRREKNRLEELPKIILESHGRLLEILLKKNIINKEDLVSILQCYETIEVV